jgi:hypothetical protein
VPTSYPDYDCDAAGNRGKGQMQKTLCHPSGVLQAKPGPQQESPLCVL